MRVPSWCREEALRAFKLGVLSLSERAAADALFDATCGRVLQLAAAHGLPLPEALQPGTRPHAATYHINLSSAPPALRPCPQPHSGLRRVMPRSFSYAAIARLKFRDWMIPWADYPDRLWW